MNQSPTTGPWTAKGPDISAADGTRIATCGITHNYAANARLIAACPDLLAALQELRDWYEDHTGLPACRANAAINKALQS